MVDHLGRAASGGALAPELPRATRSTPECIRIVVPKTFFFHFFEFSQDRLSYNPLNPIKLFPKIDILFPC